MALLGQTHEFLKGPRRRAVRGILRGVVQQRHTDIFRQAAQRRARLRQAERCAALRPFFGEARA